MPRIKRRQFLQFAGSALATIGLSQLDLQQQGLRYGKALAQDTPRKLALLVGINNYPNSNGRFSNLRGCVTDVELQRQLLMHRFGFNDKDILTLTDGAASRNGILTAFEEHLIKQAKPGDVVVFHFSGHGSYVNDPDPIDPSGKNSTFVPADDSPLAQEGVVNDIMGQTLFLLMSELKQKTENVTVLLDSCHSGGGTRGNIIVRAAEGGKKASPEEFQYQEQLMSRLNLTREKLLEERKKGVATGVVIAAAQRDEYAADYKFPGFHAGAFTYLLTQHLWQRTADVQNLVQFVNRDLENLKLHNQNPLVDAFGGKTNQLVYFTKPQTPPAEAVILEVKNDQATVWLGGIQPNSQEAFGKESIFTTVANNARGEKTRLELLSRDGLTGTAKIQGTVQPGQLLQEYARVIPADLRLHIGLDPSLGSEATAAKSALEKLNRTEAVPSKAGNEPYPKEVHYILSRTPEGSIGLFSPALELIPDSAGSAGETVTDAISRLQSKLISLLAARLVTKTLNTQSTRLNFSATMALEEQSNAIIAEVVPPRGSCRQRDDYCQPFVSRGEPETSLRKLKVGEAFQFRVNNQETRPLYLGILLIDPIEGITVFFPNEFQEGSTADLEEASLIQPNQELLIPDPKKDPFVLQTEKPGLGEVLIVASHKPLTAALLRLQELAREQLVETKGRGSVTSRGSEALDVVGNMLGDLSSRGPVAGVKARAEMNTTQMGALSITFEVV